MDLCAAGYPVGMDVCERCGATSDESCKMLDELSPKEIRENKHYARKGEKSPN